MKQLVILFLFLCSTIFSLGLSAKEYSLDEKIGQMILVGFRGLDIKDSKQIKRDIKKYHVGSIILFDYDMEKKSRTRNIKSKSQVKKLTAELQNLSDIPLLITVDQEGGLVQRLKPRHGFKSHPSPMDVGKKDDLQYTYDVSLDLAKELNEVGINLNFAPSVDVNTNPNNPVIGKIKRSYSANPEKVSEHAGEFIKAHHAADVMTTIKHFPGHGSSTKDSHLNFVDVTNTWDEKELIPFARLTSDTDVIMTAHIFHGGIDPYFPATLSERAIHDLLRGELGYRGVIISDDMNMNAISKHYGLEEAVVRAITAGVDILLFGNNLIYDGKIVSKVQKIIKRAIDEGVLTEQRIDESFERIMALKQERLNVALGFKQSGNSRSMASTTIKKVKKRFLGRKWYRKNLETFKKIKQKRLPPLLKHLMPKKEAP